MKTTTTPLKPLPPLQKNFPLDQTWSLRELNGKPVPVQPRRQPEDRRRAARVRLRGMQFVVGGDLSDQGSAPRRRRQYALTKKQCDKDTMAIEVGVPLRAAREPAWDLVNSELVIKGPRGALRLVRSL